MPYYYTPRYNIEAAKARISSDNAVAETALSSYLKKASFGSQAQQTPQAVEMPKPVEEEPKEEVSTWRRIGETLGDFFKNILVGAQKAIEGIIDFGSSTIGVIAGWAGNDALKQKMTDFTSRDLTNEWYDHLKNDYGIDTSFSHSFINDMSETGQRIIRGVSQGIGQMLPAVLTAGVGGAITGSLSAAGKIAATTANLITKGIRAANLIGLGLSAAGNSTQEALNTEIIDENGEVKHPTLDRAYLYGLASGAVEIATETLVGGGYEKLFGAGVADKLINKLAKSATFSRAAQFAFNAIGEGVEEVASEAVSNTLKTIYNSKDGKVHWESPDVMEMFESGVIGTLTAAAMGGAQAVTRRASNVATVQDTMVEIENQQKTVDDLAAEGKYEGDVAQNLENRLNENLETLSKRFQKASPKAREKMLRNNPNILDYLNEDGTIKRDSPKDGVEEIAPEQARGVMSPSLITRRNEIANTLAEHGTRIATDLDDTQRQNLQRLQTVLKNSGVKKGTSLKIVVSEQMSDANAFVNGDYMVISKERLNDTASIAKDLAHEATHFAEGSKEYTDYVDYMLDTLSAQEGDVVLEDESGSTKLNKYQQSIYDIYKNSTAAGVEGGYKISQETFAELSNGALREKISKGQALNTEERLLLSEVIAKGSEHLLGNETVINDLVERNRGLAKKMLNNIKYAIKVIETAFKGDKAALNELTTYRKAEKLFEKALATAGERYLTKKAVKRAIMTDKQSNAQNGETRYSLKPVEPIKPKSKSWRPTMDTDEALKRFPGLWNVKAEESEVRNPTQIKGTVSTYRKIYDILKKEKFNGTILDASSGLGYGTRAGIDEIKRVLLPSGTSQKLIDALNENGIEYQMYSENESRSSIIEEMDDIKFSRKGGDGKLTAQAKEIIKKALYSSWTPLDYHTMDNEDAVLDDADLTDYAKRIVDLFYSVDPEDPSGTLYDMVADEIAEDILDSAFVEWHHSSSEVEQAEAELKVLNEYRHNINLSHIMGDVQYAYDRRGMLPILGQWHNPKAKDGIDTIVMEINETFHYEYIKEDAAEIDQFEQLVDKVNHANQIIRETRRENLVSRIRRDYGGDEFEIDEVLSDIKDTVRTELIEKLLPQMDLSSENREARVRLEKETREEIEAEQRAIFEKKRAEVEREAKRSIKHIRDEVIEWKARLNELESMIGDTVLDGLPIKRGIRGKLTSENIIDAVYQLIKKSTGDTQIKYIDTLAEYVIERDYMRPLYASPKVQRAYDIAKLKKYLKNVGLPPESYFGDSYKAIAGRWTKKSPNVRAEDFIKAARKAGIEIAEIPSYTDGAQAYYEATAAAIIKINEEYTAATREMYNARQRANYSLNKIFTKEERAEIKSRIVEKIKGAVSEGKANLATSLISTYQDTISQQRALIEEGLEYNKVVNSVLDIAERLKPASARHYDDKTTLIDSNFEKIIGSLGSLKLRGDIRKASARRIIAEFGTWYTAGNKLLNGDLELSEAESALASTGQSGYLYADIIEAINGFKERVDEKAPLTLDELKDAEIILRAAEHILRNYNIETLNGQQVKLSEVSKDAHTIAAKYVNMHKTSSTIREGIRSYGYNIIDPKTVIADVMGYEDNALSQAFKDVQDGETKALTVQLDLISMVDDFFREHRGYRRRLAKATVTIDGHTIPLTHALSLYMLAQQQASTDGLTQGGWGYRSGRGNYWQDCGKLTMDTAAMRDLFTQADLDFLDVARKFFDRSGEYMYDTDMRLKGYSTVQTENSDYFPIKRYEGDFARSVDQSYMQSVMNASVQNLGVTKQRVKNARRIDVLSILDVMESHARDIGRYTGLAIPIKAFQRIYNCNISADGGVVSLRNTINEKIWSKFNQYVTNLLADIQGITGKRGVGDKAIDAIRGAYAKYQLGANVKVILSQMASFPTAFSYLSLSSMIKGIGHSFSANGVDRHTFTNMDKYCPWAKVRNANSGIVLAESVTDKIGTVGDALTKPIQWTDRLTIGMLWNSCMAEVERRHRNDAEYKYGTDTNMTEAGKLLEQVGRDTQPNYTQSERTALQRSSSSLVRMFTMFSAVPTKQISRLYEAFGRERALRYKQHTLQETVSEAERRAAHTFTTKAIVAITVANTVYVLMGELVKFILKKDRKDKNGNEISFGEDFLKDLLSTTAGMFPFIKEIYNVVVQGYDNENYVSSAINELVGSIKDLFESSAAIARGETYKKSDILRPMRDFCYALGQVTGIPVRNIYNLVYGLINRFDSETAYKMNSLFYGTSSYTQDLKSATKKGDADLQRTIIGLMLEDDGMTSTSKAVNEKIRTLYSNGYTVLPRSVRDTVSYNGSTYEMSGRQQQQFRAVYGKANAEVEKLIKSASFNHLSEEIQAKTIKWIFDYHYENGVYQVLGLVPDTKKQLFAETMDSSKFAMAIAACSFVEGEQDRKGNTKPGSKKAAVMRLLNSLSLTRNEKVMILAYLGYSVDEYAVIIKSYISRLGLTKAQQKVFLNFCGV